MRTIAWLIVLLAFVLVALFAVATNTTSAAAQEAPKPAQQLRLFFTSQGKTAIVNADGSGLKYLDFQAPGQATWQPGPSFSDGRRIVVLSMEPRRDGPGRPFEEYYPQTPTHLWEHDLGSGTLKEICTAERLAPSVRALVVEPVRGKLTQFVRTLDLPLLSPPSTKKL